jgi:hypothetical protein
MAEANLSDDSSTLYELVNTPLAQADLSDHPLAAGDGVPEELEAHLPSIQLRWSKRRSRKDSTSVGGIRRTENVAVEAMNSQATAGLNESSSDQHQSSTYDLSQYGRRWVKDVSISDVLNVNTSGASRTKRTLTPTTAPRIAGAAVRHTLIH